MEENTFIDRFFESSFELMDFRYSGSRDINTLLSFLNNLQSVNDRCKKSFDVDFSHHAEFKLLRLLRNYFQHEGDVHETRLFFSQQNVLLSHSELLIIPICVIAKAIRSFLEGKPKPWKKEEIAAIVSFSPGLCYVVDNLHGFAKDPQFLHEGHYYSGGYDLYVAVYNITNIVASTCREIDALAGKKIIIGLDDTYDLENNIGPENMITRLGIEPILTTKGYIFMNHCN